MDRDWPLELITITGASRGELEWKSTPKSSSWSRIDSENLASILFHGNAPIPKDAVRNPSLFKAWKSWERLKQIPAASVPALDERVCPTVRFIGLPSFTISHVQRSPSRMSCRLLNDTHRCARRKIRAILPCNTAQYIMRFAYSRAGAQHDPRPRSKERQNNPPPRGRVRCLPTSVPLCAPLNAPSFSRSKADQIILRSIAP